MKALDTVVLTSEEMRALAELRERLISEFDIVALMLYGSVTRGEADAESDLDVLVITGQPLNRFVRHEITDMVFELNLRYGTNISTLVVDRDSWETGLISVLPLRSEILTDGIPL